MNWMDRKRHQSDLLNGAAVTSGGLEVDVGRELKLAVGVEPRAADAAKAIVCAGGVSAGGPGGRGAGNVNSIFEIHVGVIELWRIPQVISLGAEFCVDPFGDMEPLEEAKVHGLVTRTGEGIALEVSGPGEHPG